MLAQNCDDCIFLRQTDKGRCIRHAPSTREEEFSVTYWPPVPPVRRCGQGVSKTAPRKDGEPELTPCVACAHFYPPVTPKFRGLLSREWWEGAGYCTASAPYPSADPHRKVHTPVTHETDGCGDGGVG